jgi:hypothetical protein
MQNQLFDFLVDKDIRRSAIASAFWLEVAVFAAV